MKNAYKAVLEFIELAKQELETEITAVIIPEVDIQKVEKLAQEKGVNFRKRPFSQSYIQSEDIALEQAHAGFTINITNVR